MKIAPTYPKRWWHPVRDLLFPKRHEWTVMVGDRRPYLRCERCGTEYRGYDVQGAFVESRDPEGVGPCR